MVEARRHYPVRLNGVVTHHDAAWNILFVQDAMGGIYLYPPGEHAQSLFGQRVEIEGRSQPGPLTPFVSPVSLKVLGPGKLPEARPTTALHLLAGKEDCQWVELVGVVKSLNEIDGHMELTVQEAGQGIKAFVMGAKPYDWLRLLDAQVRLRGVCSAQMNERGELSLIQIYVPGPEQILIEKAAPADPFVLPIRPVAELARLGPVPETNQVRIQGVVSDWAPGKSFTLRDRSGTVVVEASRSSHMANQTLVDVVGSVSGSGTSIRLKQGQYRRLGLGESDGTSIVEGTEHMSLKGEPLRLLLNTRQVRGLSPSESERGYPVRLRAVVTYYDAGRNICYVQDSTGGIYLAPRDQELDIRAGDSVEVEGYTEMGDLAPILTKPRFQILGRALLPAAPLVSLDRLATGKEDGQWVEVTGVVRVVAKAKGQTYLDVGLETRGELNVRFPFDWDGSLPSNLLAARVNVRGVCGTLFNQKRQLIGVQLLVPGLDSILVTRPAVADPFSLPLQSIVSLMRYRSELGRNERIRVQGIVTLQRGTESLFLQEGAHGLYVKTQGTNLFEVGDLVEGIGFPALGKYTPVLEHAILRRISAGTPVKPAPATIDQARSGEVDAELITLDARLVDHVSKPWDQVLILQSGQNVFDANLELGKGEASLKNFQPGSQVKVTGVCSIQPDEWGNPRAFRLLLRSAGDVQVVQGPPWWTARRMFATLGIMLGFAVLAGGWGMTLQNRVRAQTRVINQQLRRVSAYAELGQKLSAGTTPADAARTIVSASQEFLGWDACFLCLHLPESNQIELLIEIDTVNGERREFQPPYSRMEISPMILRVIHEGPQLILRQASSDPPHNLAPAGDPGQRSASLMFVPIHNGTRTIGVLSIQSYQANAYDRDDLETLQALADHGGGALERIQAQEKLKRAHDDLELKVRERTQELQLAHAHLEKRVAQRTSELSQSNVLLQQEMDERRQTEEALRESEERFARAFRANPVAVSLSTVAEGRLIEVNDSFLRLFGFRREEVIGRTTLELGLWVNPEERALLVRLLNRQQLVRDMEFKFRAKSGTIRQTLVSVEPIELGKESCMLFITHDVTERLNLEAQLRHSQKMEAVGQLAAGVAHDFNNLLTIIQGHASSLVGTVGYDAATVESLNEVSAAAERAANLTKQLLTFSRKQVMQPKTLDLNEVIGNAAKLLRRLMGENISLQFNYAPSLPPIHADTGMMEQILINLAVNARDAMPTGGLLAIGTAAPVLDGRPLDQNGAARSGTFVCLSVTDAGCGMDEVTLARIFEPFFTTKEVGKGTGLGLATVYGIVNQHHGWIEVASQVGKGTAFKIYLPCQSKAILPAAPAPPPAKIHGGNETILVVEDEAALLALVQSVLQRFGYDVLTAANGKEALDVWSEQGERITLLLTDMMMPEGISGWDLAERLKAKRPGLKVIYTSGYSVDLFGENLELREGINFLAKPYLPKALAKTVRLCLDGS